MYMMLQFSLLQLTALQGESKDLTDLSKLELCGLKPVSFNHVYRQKMKELKSDKK